MGDSVRILFALLISFFLFSAFGCGYHLSGNIGQGGAFAGKTIAVPIFVNKSYLVNGGAILSQSIVDEFAKRTGGRVVHEDYADLILSGTILTYSSSIASFSAYDVAKEYKAEMKVEAVLREKVSQKVIWKGTLSWSQEYPVNTDIFLQRNNEDAAVQEICRKLAMQIYQSSRGGF